MARSRNNHEDVGNSDGGVEEKKEEESLQYNMPPNQDDGETPRSYYKNPRQRSESDSAANAAAKTEQSSSWIDDLLGSCGVVMEAASQMLQGNCKWPNKARRGQRTKEAQRQPLSIVEELKLLGPQPAVVHPRDRMIPRFLGEESVQPFEEDDDVSALSQHTLEEMSRANGGRVRLHHVHRRLNSSSSKPMRDAPPSPTRTTSNSTTNSSNSDQRREEEVASEL